MEEALEEAQTKKKNIFVRIKINTSHASLTWVGRKLNAPFYWEWRKLQEKNKKYLSAYIRIEINNSHELSIL